MSATMPASSVSRPLQRSPVLVPLTVLLILASIPISTFFFFSVVSEVQDHRNMVSIPKRSSNEIPLAFRTMSPAPPAPTQTNAPAANAPFCIKDAESEGDDSATVLTPPSPEAVPDLPEPLLRLELRDLRQHPTGVFLQNFNASSDMANLVRTVLTLLYVPRTASRGSRSSSPSRFWPRPSKRTKLHIPNTRSITLVLRSMDGVAYTTGIELDSQHKEIHFSLSYIENVSTKSCNAASIRKELMGVVCHELVHCWQWDAQGTAPGGLIEGIADWVRLNAGFIPPHWKREAGPKTKWDAGYQTTGYFLDWIEHKRGAGSVQRINEALREKKYDENIFWRDLFGDSVHDLWAQYSKSIEKGGDDKDGGKEEEQT